jgi:hypothetical protein
MKLVYSLLATALIFLALSAQAETLETLKFKVIYSYNLCDLDDDGETESCSILADENSLELPLIKYGNEYAQGSRDKKIRQDNQDIYYSITVERLAPKNGAVSYSMSLMTGVGSSYSGNLIELGSEGQLMHKITLVGQEKAYEKNGFKQAIIPAITGTWIQSILFALNSSTKIENKKGG